MKRVLCVVLCVLLAATTFSACNTAPAIEDEEVVTTTAATTTTTKDLSTYNALTGEYTLAPGSSTRPIGIMCPNDSATIGKQVGLDKADFVMECETEGGIPRLLAIFPNAASVPEKFGPVRSARSPFIKVARAFGLVYCHAGGSGPAKTILNTGVLDHLDAITDAKTFWRDNELKAAIDYVHSVVTSGKALTSKLEKSSFSKDAICKLPFTFGEKLGTEKADQAQFNSTISNYVTMVYNEKTGLYEKNNGKMGSCKPHKTLNGTQLAFKNVIVLFAEKYVDAKYNKTVVYNFRNGQGTGYALVNGTYRPIKFLLGDDTLSLYEEDGRPLTLATGKTYACLVDKTKAGNTKFAAGTAPAA